MSLTPHGRFSLRAVGASTLLITAATIAGQGLSLGRELFVASQVGLSAGLDALLIALVLPTVLSGLLTGGSSAALVPAYLDVRRSRGRAEARRLAGAVLTWIVVAGIGLTGIALSFAGPIILLVGPGLGRTAHAMAEDFLPLVAPLLLMSGLSGVLSAVCQAEQRFGGIAASTLAGAFTGFVTTLSLWPHLHLSAIAVGLVGAAAATLAVLVAWTTGAGILPTLTFKLHPDEARAFGRHALPLILGSGVLQFNLVADRAIASIIAPGAVSALRYADVLVRTPVSAIGPAWGQALYPSLVGAAQQSETRALGSAVVQSLRYTVSVFVPIAVTMAALAPWFVEAVFARGAFSAADVDVTSKVVAGFAPLIVILMVLPVLTGAHNARRSGMLLLVTGTLNALSNLALNVIFGALIGVAGIALSTSLSTGVLTWFLARRLERRETGLTLLPVWSALGRATAAALIPALPLAVLAWSGVVLDSGGEPVVPLVAAIVLMAASYLVLSARIGLREPLTVARFITRPIARWWLERSAT